MMRQWLDRLRIRALSGPEGGFSVPRHGKAGEGLKFVLFAGLILAVFLSSLLFDSPGGIIRGLGRVYTSPSTLLSDYLAIGGPGAAFANCGLMMGLCLLIARKTGAEMNGPVIAAVIMVGGFSLFGKNPLNALPIMTGVALLAKWRHERFSNYILSAFFGLAMGPLVSYLAFGLGWPLQFSLPLGILAGVSAGFVLPVLALHFTSFHQGYSLYNMGFTCGILGMAVMALLRALGLGNNALLTFPLIGYETPLLIWILAIIAFMALAGWLLSPSLGGTLRELMREPGRLSGDFVSRFGIGPVMVNMALLGLMSVGYVFLSGGRLTGPTLGAILSVMSFGGFGKHPRNVWPILLGAQIMARLGIWDVSSDAVVIAALFGTNLVPIPGSFGWPLGILAGFLHVAVSLNLGFLHGYINLYNNGFAGGFVAAILLPLIRLILAKRSKAGATESFDD